MGLFGHVTSTIWRALLSCASDGARELLGLSTLVRGDRALDSWTLRRRHGQAGWSSAVCGVANGGFAQGGFTIGFTKKFAVGIQL